jgi:hypothetical protein
LAADAAAVAGRMLTLLERLASFTSVAIWFNRHLLKIELLFIFS